MSTVIDVEPTNADVSMGAVTNISGSKCELTTPAALNPAQLLQQAVMNGVNPDILQKLMDAQERWEERQARKAFDEALAAARAEIPNIHKSKKGHGYSYEGLDDIARTVVPILGKYGLSYRWQTDAEEKTIKVTCILSHRSGHSEDNALVAPINSVSTKMQNPIQAMGSAITYLQRYTLKAALGLSASVDDDAAAVTMDTTPITTEQRDNLIGLMNEHGIDIARFCAHFQISHIGEVKATDYQSALAAINKSIAQRKQQQQQQEAEAANV